MLWRFSILDRNNITTVIEEPVGWDATKITIKRDLEKHGVFFDYQGNDFRFYDNRKGERGAFDVPYDEEFSANKPGGAFGIIKDEYETYGVEGNLILIIEQSCGTAFEELYRGRLAFREYKEYCGSECYCKIPIETTSDVITLNNRFDQKVNLESLVSFDGITNMDAYEKLGKKIQLKSKGVFMKDQANLTEQKELLVKLSDIGYLFPPSTSSTRYAWFNMELPFNKSEFSEFGNFNPETEIVNNFIAYGSYHAAGPNGFKELDFIFKGTYSDDPTFPQAPPQLTSVLFDWAPNPYLMYYNPDNPNNLDFIQKFATKISTNYSLSLKECWVFAWHHAVVKRKADGTIEVLDNDIQINVGTNSFQYWEQNTDRNLSYNKTLTDVTLGKGEYLFFVVAGVIAYDSAKLDTGEAFKITATAGTIEATTLSYSQPTTAKAFLINEAWSRITEAITDNKLRAYSEYFGRKDSQPYSVSQDGCGALEAITSGLFLRDIVKKDDNDVVFTQSLKDMWEGLEPIHHIGIGIENDSRRPGYKCLRVEPWKYFYSQDIILTLDGVDEIAIEAQESEHYSTFTFGYEKYEAEEFNGLDEFLTQRFYRTTLTQVKNSLSKLSKMVASGYAIEITKRKGNKDSKDWRFDNDTFIICLKRGMPILPAQSFNVQFLQTSIRFMGVTEAPYWVIVGEQFTISGAVLPGNNKTFLINNAYTDNGDFYIGVASPYPVINSTTQTVLVTPVSDPDGLVVEMGGITDAQNIIDPDTIYNFRISPIRNAMRWTDKLFSGYRNINESSQAIFMDGKGNYFASGLMNGNCIIELKAMAENETIDISKFSDSDMGMPVLRPERIPFTYPMSVKDFKTILANPYGVIKIVDSCKDAAGWIDEITYTPEEGMATFKLIPAYNNDAFIVPQGIFNTPYATQME
jgi:hypothetical protein